MKPSSFDEICDEIISNQPVDDEKGPQRGDWYPNYYSESGLAKRIMQLPARFRHLWVVKPINKLGDYSNIFTFHKEIEFNGDIIRSYTSPLNHELIPDSSYIWFLYVLLGDNKKDPLFPTLNIDGIKSNISNYIDKIITEGDIHYIELWRCFYIGNEASETIVLAKMDLPLWFSFLKMIPVEIVTDSRMEAISPSSIKALIKRNPDDSIENLSEIMETLGLYCSNTHKGSRPSIYLCKERIDKVARKLGYDPDMLFAIVYLHELAHAAMDQTNEIEETPNYNYRIKKNEKIFTTNEYSDFLEESLANMIMLQYVDWYSELTDDQTLFDTASSFVAQQSPMYKYGLDLFKADIDWTKWRDYKEKHEEPGEELKEWFDNKDDFNTLKKVFD